MARTGTMPAVEVSGITPVAYPFGLFSAGAPSPFPDDHALAGVWWQGAGCQSVGVTHDPCIVDLAVPALAANVVCDVNTAASFTVFARSDQSLGGRSLAERQAQARDVLVAGEQFAVEATLWALLLAATVADVTAAVTVQEGVARLEGRLRASYGGTGVVHLSPFAATMAADSGVLRVDGARLRTFLGSSAVAGGGYGNPATLIGDQVMFATGPVQLFRSELLDLGQVIDHRINLVQSVVQRTYSVGWDCVALRISL